MILEWNDALWKGDIKLAEALTSNTSAAWIKAYVSFHIIPTHHPLRRCGSLEKLSNMYQSNLEKCPDHSCTVVQEEIMEDMAIVVYRMYYNETDGTSS